MAHFAELDENNIVKRVIVVDNTIPTAAGPLGENDMHADGEAYCKNLLGADTIWKQTSYNNNFRKEYAFIGGTYDAAKDKFIKPQPYPSFVLDVNDDWKSLVDFPPIDKQRITAPAGGANGVTFTTTSGDSLITINWTSHGASVGDMITLVSVTPPSGSSYTADTFKKVHGHEFRIMGATPNSFTIDVHAKNTGSSSTATGSADATWYTITKEYFKFRWDEANQRWIAQDADRVDVIWNPSTSSLDNA